MGAKIFAVITVIAIVTICVFNTKAVNKRIDELTGDIEASESQDDAKAIREKYQRYERLISITVSHEDLMTIEDLLAEYESAMEIDPEGAKITKSRLLGAFSHLRRLCNLNIGSII